LAARLVDLYRVRIIADYQGRRVVSLSRLAGAGRDARYILRVTEDVLPER